MSLSKQSVYKQDIAFSLKNRLKLSPEEIVSVIGNAPENIDAHFSLPCFSFAKDLRKAPNAIAEELAKQITLPGYFEKIFATNGYLNFKVNANYLSKSILSEIYTQKENFGKLDLGKGKLLTIDFSSPNMGKELAFHHLRGTMLGNSLSRIFTKAGYRVVRINHLGDWGTSYGKLIVMYLEKQLPMDDRAISNISIEDLNLLYQAFAQASESNPGLEEKAREAFQRLEAGDKEYLRLWAAFRETTLRELKRIYAELEVDFDEYKGEAFFAPQSEDVIKELKEKNLWRESQGAQIVDLEPYNLLPLMLKKSDGSTVYATRDICAALYRKKTYNFDLNLYVVDGGQALHFEQFFKVLELMGHSWVKQCEHIQFGLILNKNEEGKWEKGKTRAGKASLLKEVLDEAGKKILEIIDAKNPELKHKEVVAYKIGIGALVFNDLKNKRQTNVKFDWDSVLSFEGDTGPYVVNAYVRLSSILRKAGLGEASINALYPALNYSNISDTYSLDLIITLNSLADKVKAAMENREAYILGQFALTLADKAHRFIHHNKVIGSPEQSERLFLVYCTRIILGETMNLLGVPRVEEM